MERLRTAQANALRQTMVDALSALTESHEKYRHALDRAMDAEAGPNEISALMREGSAYAQSVTRHAEAAMAWLVYAKTHLQVTFKVRKAGNDF